MDDSKRFWDLVEDQGGCMIWMGAVHARSGRGLFKCDGKTWDAARLAWAEENGPVPDGHVVKPMCPDYRCVNPQHLLPVRPGMPATPISQEEYDSIASDEAAFAAMERSSERIRTAWRKEFRRRATVGK